MRYALAALPVAVVLMSCTTIGNKFDAAKVDQLRPGVSTKADAAALLGNPSATSSAANGGSLLQWQYSQGTLVGANAAHVAILFDDKGRMVRVTHRFQQ